MKGLKKLRRIMEGMKWDWRGGRERERERARELEREGIEL